MNEDCNLSEGLRILTLEEEEELWRLAACGDVLNYWRYLIPGELKIITGEAYGLEGVVNWEGKCGFVDKEGKLVIPCIYDQVFGFSEGLACAYKNDKAGFIDTQGEVVIDFSWVGGSAFFEGLCRVYDGKNYGFIDKQGKLVGECIWMDADFYDDGYAIVKGSNGRYGFIDKTGELVIPFKWRYVDCTHEALDYFSDGTIWVEDYYRNRFRIDKQGNVLEKEKGYWSNREP